jgi:hypothetical protein
MNKLLLTGLSISWRVDYDEKGEAIGKHVAICVNAEEAAPFGKRLGANLMLTEAMLNQIKVNEALWKQWIDEECKRILHGFAFKAAQENIEMNPLDFIVPMRTQLDIGIKRFCENERPWHHIFYLIKTLKPGETIIDDIHISLKDLESTCEGFINTGNEPKVIVIKAD